MTSFGVREAREGNFMATFKMKSQVYYRIGRFIPDPQNSFQFSRYTLFVMTMKGTFVVESTLVLSQNSFANLMNTTYVLCSFSNFWTLRVLESVLGPVILTDSYQSMENDVPLPKSRLKMITSTFSVLGRWNDFDALQKTSCRCLKVHLALSNRWVFNRSLKVHNIGIVRITVPRTLSGTLNVQKPRRWLLNQYTSEWHKDQVTEEDHVCCWQLEDHVTWWRIMLPTAVLQTSQSIFGWYVSKW